MKYPRPISAAQPVFMWAAEILIQKSHKKATVKIDSKTDWQSVLDSIIEFVKGKGLGETQNLQITFDAQPA